MKAVHVPTLLGRVVGVHNWHDVLYVSCVTVAYCVCCNMIYSIIFKGPKEEIGHYHETIGEALQGVELEFSGLDISFKGIPYDVYHCFEGMCAVYVFVCECACMHVCACM